MTPLHAISALLVCLILISVVEAQDNYQPGPDSTTQPSVPKGELLKFTFEKSKIFPGTTREYSVYIPTQYTPDKPACVYIAQDGVQHQAPTVFDNLIRKKEIPVLIGVFIRPGVVKAASTPTALDRFNRSYEYDGLGDNYARFLLEELLPDVETKKATDGRAIVLSKSGNDRAIGGQSSGAIAAFTAAWERPNEFSRVFSGIGTFVDLRGGMRYPSLIRKYEPKPIRVFLQDGSNDNNRGGGDWWMANQTMERALTFAGYEVEHAWGDGGHNARHATAIFPDIQRFLWKDWPTPVKNGVTKNNSLTDILVEGEGWQLAAEGLGRTDAPAVNQKGEVFFRAEGKTHVIGLDGKLGTTDIERVQAFDAENKPRRLPPTTAPFTGLNDMVVAHNGNAYLTDDPPRGSDAPSRVWLVKPDGAQQVVDTGLRFANGITLSPDQTLLYVSDYRTHWVWSYQVQPDGTLAHKQQFYWLHEPDTADDAGADGLCVDADGRLYVATRMGIQICDQAGKVQCIVPTPNGRISALCFGGEKFDTIFATCGDKVFKRKVKVTGAPAWKAPSKPAAPRL